MKRWLTKREIGREITMIRKLRAALEPFRDGLFSEKTCDLFPADLDEKLALRYAELRRIYDQRR